MALYFKDIKDSLQLYIWKCEETIEELYCLLGDSAPALKKECEARFHNETKMQEWLSVRVLLRTVLGDHVTVGYRPNGEPYLTRSRLRVSISHTQGYVCIALHSVRHIGVDIEIFSNRINRLVPRIMHPFEKPFLPLSNDEATWYSLIVWSVKESVFKCLDIAILDYHHGIRLEPFRLSKQGDVNVSYHSPHFCYPIRAHYLCTSSFVLTWCEEL